MARERTEPVHGLIFDAESVRGLLGLDGLVKTETRRLVTQHTSDVGSGLLWRDLDWERVRVDPGGTPLFGPGPYLKVGGPHETMHRVYSRLSKGDLIYVKESFVTARVGRGRVIGFRATDSTEYGGELGAGTPWKSSLFLKRDDARIHLRVTSLDVQRLWDITDEAIVREGVRARAGADLYTCWQRRWEQVNGKRCPFKNNPWVWVYGLAVEKPQRALAAHG